MSQLMFLERFDDKPKSPSDETPVEELPGYAAGFAAGQSAAEDRSAALDEAMIVALSELSFGYNEALQHVMQSHGPLFEALSHAVLPAVSDDILALQVLSILKEAAQNDASASVTIAVPAGHGASLQSRLTDRVAMPIVFVEDHHIPHGQALVTCGDTATTLNVSGLIENIQGILEILPDTYERTERHG